MTTHGINAQYNVAKAGSLPVRVAAAARRRMFDTYLECFPADADDAVLDVGATSEQSYEASNYFEAWYPHKARITALGLDDAQFLEARYPGLRFVQGNGLEMPFEDRSFDIVHSSAVIEHVGSRENQLRFIRELCRVSRRGVFFTTPNRWFPVEFHTLLPLVHWLPPRAFRAIVSAVRDEFFASEDNLNLLSPRDVRLLSGQVEDFSADVRLQSLGGWPSNIMAVLRRA